MHRSQRVEFFSYPGAQPWLKYSSGPKNKRESVSSCVSSNDLLNTWQGFKWFTWNLPPANPESPDRRPLKETYRGWERILWAAHFGGGGAFEHHHLQPEEWRNGISEVVPLFLFVFFGLCLFEFPLSFQSLREEQGIFPAFWLPPWLWKSRRSRRVQGSEVRSLCFLPRAPGGLCFWGTRASQLRDASSLPVPPYARVAGLYSSLIFKELPKFGGTRKEALRKPTESKAIVNIYLLGSSTQKLKEVETNSTQDLQRTQSKLKTPRSWAGTDQHRKRPRTPLLQ